MGRLSPYPSGTACPPPQRPVLPPGSSELRRASWRPGGVRPGGRRGRESRALQSRRAAQSSDRWVAWAPRPSGLVTRRGHHSRHLGLRQGPGRLGAYLTPASAPSAVPLHGSPTSELEARRRGAPVTGLTRPRGRLCQPTPDAAGSSPWVSSIPTRARPDLRAQLVALHLVSSPSPPSCLQRDPLLGLCHHAGTPTRRTPSVIVPAAPSTARPCSPPLARNMLFLAESTAWVLSLTFIARHPNKAFKIIFSESSALSLGCLVGEGKGSLSPGEGVG